MTRPDPWRIALVVYALVAVWHIYEVVATERLLAEVTLSAIVVEMDDPFPCSSNREHRIAFARQGAVCSGVQR